MKKIRFGIVGVGNQGTYYANILKEGKVTNGILVGLCDNDPSKIEKAKENFKNVAELQYFSNYKDLINANICDVIMVETPHYYHPEIVIECLNKGINVICDKPAGVYTKQVREMNEIASRSKAKFTMMFNQRTNCVYRKMREMIKDGVLGSLQRVSWIITDWYRTQFYYDNGEWRATWVGEGGGVLINQCPHQIDLLQWILGKLPTKVSAHCHYGMWHDIEVEDDVTAYLEFDNGATGVFVTTTGEAPGTNRLEISGTKGKLLCENDTLIFFENEIDSQENSKVSPNGYDKPNCKKIIVETDGQNPQHVGIMNNFANALLGIEDLFIDGIEGINGVELHNAISLSGWKNGEIITLPVDEEEYLKELNKRKFKSKNSYK
jgi:predicted dehydrogenase